MVAGPAAGLALVGGGNRALSAPDEHAGDRHGRALPRGPRGQHLPRLRPERAGHQRGAGRAGGRSERDIRAARWPAPRGRARSSGFGRSAAAVGPEHRPAFGAMTRPASRSATALRHSAALARRPRGAEGISGRAASPAGGARLRARCRSTASCSTGTGSTRGTSAARSTSASSPIITKQDLRDLPASDVVANGIDPASLVSVRTNGSTGEPFVVRRTRLEQGFHTMFRQRAYEAFGLGLRGRIAAVSYSRRPTRRTPRLLGDG